MGVLGLPSNYCSNLCLPLEPRNNHELFTIYYQLYPGSPLTVKRYLYLRVFHTETTTSPKCKVSSVSDSNFRYVNILFQITY